MSDTYYIFYTPRRVYVENHRDERMSTRYFDTYSPVRSDAQAQIRAMREYIRALAEDLKVPAERIHAVGQPSVQLIGRAADILAAGDRPGGTGGTSGTGGDHD